MNAITRTTMPLDSDVAGAPSEERQRRAALAVLYRAHAKAILGYAYRRTGDAHQAEDVTSDVFVRAFEHFDELDPGPRGRAWLLHVATNLINRWARRRQLIGWLVGEEHLAHVAERNADATDECDTPRIRAALLRLPPRFQTVLALHYVEGLDVDQITAILRCPRGTVHSRLSRGRELLRRSLSVESNP